MQQDRGAGHDGPGRPLSKGVDDQCGEAQVGQGRREFHQGSDGWVGGVRHGLERRLDRRQNAPDVDHDRPEGDVHPVGIRQPVDRDAVDPQDELVQVRPEAFRGQQDEPDGDPDEERNEKRDPMAAASSA